MGRNIKNAIELNIMPRDYVTRFLNDFKTALIWCKN